MLPLFILLSSLTVVNGSNPIVIYSTTFDAAQGYDHDFDLVGQNGWIGDGSGGNGLLTNYFPGLGQQAYLGFSPPSQGDDTLSVWRPITLAPIPTATPIVKFSVLMEIVDSTNGEYDNFYWSVYNAQGHRFFTLDFDNFDTGIYYSLDNTNGFVSTGKVFTNNIGHALVITMNFAQNKLSATLDNVLLITNLPITTVGATLNLGDVDAVWVIYEPAAPGNNFMAFDNYRITAEGAPPIPARLQTLGRTSDGKFALRLTGDPGCNYAIEATANGVSWSALGTNNATHGVFDFVDTAAPGFPRRLYRARLVP